MADYNKSRDFLVDMYIKSLEENEIPWQKMWSISVPKNIITGSEYRGINNLILSYIMTKRNYKDYRWCTYNQMKKKKWKFKEDAKGKGIPIEYYTMYDKVEKKNYHYYEYNQIIKHTPEKKDDFELRRKCTTVFNCSIIDGVPELSKEFNNSKESSVFIENVIKNLDVGYEEKGSEAYYDISADKVVIPPSKYFKNEYSYYATQLHELSHSTGHSSRLDRNIANIFGTPEYAKEELRAEISSSFLVQKLGLEFDEKHCQNHKAYIQNWLQILKDKPKELFNAISDSNKIVDYIEEKSLIIGKSTIKNNEIEMELEYE